MRLLDGLADIIKAVETPLQFATVLVIAFVICFVAAIRTRNHSRTYRRRPSSRVR